MFFYSFVHTSTSHKSLNHPVTPSTTHPLATANGGEHDDGRVQRPQQHPTLQEPLLQASLWGSKSPKALIFDPWRPGEVAEEEVNEHNTKYISY